VKAALAGAVAIGAAIGLLLPQQPQQPSAAAAAAAVVAAPYGNEPAQAAPGTGGRWGGETRLAAGAGGHFYTSALVNGHEVDFVVDTGASTVALTMEDARRAGVAFDPGQFTVIGRGASGPVRGQEVSLTSVSVDGKEVRSLRGAVLEGLEESLLGQSYLSRISEVRMSSGEMILR